MSDFWEHMRETKTLSTYLQRYTLNTRMLNNQRSSYGESKSRTSHHHALGVPELLDTILLLAGQEAVSVA